MAEKVDKQEEEIMAEEVEKVRVSPVAETRGPTSSNSKIVVTSPPSGRPEDTDAGASANGHDCRKVGGPVITGRESSIGQVQYCIVTKSFLTTGKPDVPTASPASIQELVNKNPTKKGICLLLSCTKPDSGKPIGRSDALHRMRECFAEKLGYLVVKEETNISSRQLEQTLAEVEKLTLPKSYSRVFFYFFGHGNDTSICLKDKSYKRTDIIKRLQSISSTHSEICKIFFFDCCRRIPPVGSQPIQVVDNEASSTFVLGQLFSGPNDSEGDFTPGPNTFIIYATDFNSEAYFISHLKENEVTKEEVNGCGLATLFLTKLAPIRNESLANLLTEVRSEVYKYIKEHPDNVERSEGSLCYQLLDYKDRLMEKVNFLAESRGADRVTPTGINITPFVLNTNVNWKFSDDVESRIKHFQLSVSPTEPTRSEQEAIDPVCKPSKDRSASLSNLKPSTEYHLTIAAEYEDGKQGLSKQTFRTADRSTPKNIQITSNQSSDAADISWDFSRDMSGLSCFIVKAKQEGEEEPVEVKVTNTSVRKATLTPLIPSSTYTISVVAVYKDNVEEKCSVEFVNCCNLSKATGLSATLIRLDPPQIEFKWSYEVKDALEPQRFEVLAQPDHNSSATPITILSIPIGSRSKCLTILKHTTYTLTVTTTYGKNTRIESEAIQFKGPEENEVKPVIVKIESKEQTSADVEFTPPQRSEYGERLQLTRYSILVRPHGYPDSEETSESGGIPDEKYTRRCSELEVLPDGHRRRVKLAGLLPGNKYKVKVYSHYSSGEIVPSAEEVFETKPAVCRNICTCTIITMLLIVSAILGFAYLPYAIILQGSTACQSSYTLSYDTTQCGYGNSLQYIGADVKGCPIEGDIMTDTLTVRRIHDYELKLYFKTPLTVHDSGLKTKHSTFLLLGWQIYTWSESIIAGFCCITNNNNETKTASLHMFRRNSDANRFRNGEGVRNAIISENINVPPKQTSCFHKWGIDAPYTVKHSAYHYIGLDLPANMNYTANITMTQSYVNISDYPNSPPQFFRRDNYTHFTYPHTWFKRSDYLYICEAPLYLPETNAPTSQRTGVVSSPIYRSKKTTSISRPNSSASSSSYVSEMNMTEPDPSNAVSLHVCICNSPYPWMEPTAIGITVSGGFGVLSILLIVGCLCLYKFRHRMHMVTVRYLRRCYGSYERLQVED